MAILATNQKVQYVAGPPPVNQIPTSVVSGDMNSVRANVAIDGTPVRVCMFALMGAAGVVALRWAGFKFNVGVS